MFFLSIQFFSFQTKCYIHKIEMNKILNLFLNITIIQIYLIDTEIESIFEMKIKINKCLKLFNCNK